MHQTDLEDSKQNNLLLLFFYLDVTITLCSHPVIQKVSPFLNAIQAWF